MSSVDDKFDGLIRALELSQQQYLNDVRTLHKALATRVKEAETRGSQRGPPESREASDAGSLDESGSKTPGDELETPSLAPPLRTKLTAAEESFTSEEHKISRAIDAVSKPISVVKIPQPSPVTYHQPTKLTDQGLISYLGDLISDQEFEPVAHLLKHHQSEIDILTDFSLFGSEPFGDSGNTNLFDVAEGGLAREVIPSEGLPEDASPNNLFGAQMLWSGFKKLCQSHDSVGRIILTKDPTPLNLGVLHHSLSPYFDMNELVGHVAGTARHGHRTTTAGMLRAFVADSSANLTRRRSFLFAFKYYTLIGDGIEPRPWQRYDNSPAYRTFDHIDIVTCSSVLALSLSGPSRKVVARSKRPGFRAVGDMFDPFAPWHLLSIQDGSDDEETIRKYSNQHFVNGPHAFLQALTTEYRDAVNRNRILQRTIARLITPPEDFVFNPRLRDALLLEDKSFVYIRRYFWAYNTLGVINDCIVTMIEAYKSTFTDEFWEAKHPILWPHSDPNSARAIEYRATLAPLRKELEHSCRDLEAIIADNTATKKAIDDLERQLSSGKNRRAIEQGDNIKVLTLISMIFLPLTFVTSIFGMTQFDIPPTDWRFPVITVCVFIPFIFLLTMLQTHGGGSILGQMFKRPKHRQVAGLYSRYFFVEIPTAAGGFAKSVVLKTWHTLRHAMRGEWAGQTKMAREADRGHDAMELGERSRADAAKMAQA